MGRPRSDYRRLHDIARHVIHVSETLDVATHTMCHILTRHGDLMGSVAAQDILREIHSRLQVFESLI